MWPLGCDGNWWSHSLRKEIRIRRRLSLHVHSTPTVPLSTVPWFILQEKNLPNFGVPLHSYPPRTLPSTHPRTSNQGSYREFLMNNTSKVGLCGQHITGDMDLFWFRRESCPQAPKGGSDQSMPCTVTTGTTWPRVLLNSPVPTLNKEMPILLGHEHQSYVSPFRERQSSSAVLRQKKYVDHCENVSISPWYFF